MYTYLPQNRIGYSFWILCTSCNCTVDLAVETMIWDSFYETKRRDRKKNLKLWKQSTATQSATQPSKNGCAAD